MGDSLVDKARGRTVILLGDDGVNRLAKSHVAVFGIGGVGGYAVEALVRSGIGEITIVDSDEVEPSNINRQIIATTATVGQKKVDVMARRIAEISPTCVVHARDCFFLPETADEFDFSIYDYVVDAVDTVTAKLEIIVRAKADDTPVISCMGAGNKLDATRFKVADIYETSVCPLARVMRRELRKRGIDALKVVYSDEPTALNGDTVASFEAGWDATVQCDIKYRDIQSDALQDAVQTNSPDGNLGCDLKEACSAQAGKRGKNPPGSVVFVVGVAGLILAGEVVHDLIGI